MEGSGSGGGSGTNPQAAATPKQRGRLMSILYKGKDRCLMLDRETLLRYLPTFAMAALLGVTAINVLTSNQSMGGGDTGKNQGLRQFLLSMPYTMFVFAFVGLTAAAAVKRRHGVIGCATGTLLVQLICVIVMGGVVTQVRGEVETKIVWPVTAGIIVSLVVVWTAISAYPKFLRSILCCCCPDENVKEKADGICQVCGGDIDANGRSSNPAPNPAPQGTVPCPRCGGAPDDKDDLLPGIVTD